MYILILIIVTLIGAWSILEYYGVGK